MKILIIFLICVFLLWCFGIKNVTESNKKFLIKYHNIFIIPIWILMFIIVFTPGAQVILLALQFILLLFQLTGLYHLKNKTFFD